MCDCYLSKTLPRKSGKIYTILFLFFRMGLACDPIPFDRSTILVEMMTVMHLVTFVQPPMLVERHKMSLGPVCFLGFLGVTRVNQLHAALPFVPF